MRTFIARDAASVNSPSSWMSAAFAGFGSTASMTAYLGPLGDEGRDEDEDEVIPRLETLAPSIQTVAGPPRTHKFRGAVLANDLTEGARGKPIVKQWPYAQNRRRVASLEVPARSGARVATTAAGARLAAEASGVAAPAPSAHEESTATAEAATQRLLIRSIAAGRSPRPLPRAVPIFPRWRSTCKGSDVQGVSGRVPAGAPALVGRQGCEPPVAGGAWSARGVPRPSQAASCVWSPRTRGHPERPPLRRRLGIRRHVVSHGAEVVANRGR